MNRMEIENHIRYWLVKNKNEDFVEHTKPRYDWSVSQLGAVLDKMNKGERHRLYMSLKAIKGKTYPDQNLAEYRGHDYGND